MKCCLSILIAILAVTAQPAWPQQADQHKTGEVRENPKDGLKYVWISPGTFTIGCSAGDKECFYYEGPSHPVTITRGFWIGQTEVTAAAYKRFAAATGRQMPTAPGFNKGWADGNIPILDVPWDDAQAYCGWVGGRLPTEAEWEYAGRGGSTEPRYGPLDEVAWYTKNSGGRPHDVAQKRPNAYGLYDMLGNTCEWVSDWYANNFQESGPVQDPQGPETGQFHVLRGGAWYMDARDNRVSIRNTVYPLGHGLYYGFRCGGNAGGP